MRKLLILGWLLVLVVLWRHEIVSAFARVYKDDEIRKEIMFAMRNSGNPPDQVKGSYNAEQHLAKWRNK